MAAKHRPFLILDCYYDEKGSAPNFRALLAGAPSVTVRAVREPMPVDLEAYSGILVTGSKGNLPDPEPWMAGLLKFLREAQQRDLPMLGICFGHQAIAVAAAGPGAVRTAPKGELGWATIRVDAPNPILEGLQSSFTCFVSHFDEVLPATAGLNAFASSEHCAVEGYQVEGQRTWGLQFHPEMDPEESESLVRSNAGHHVDRAKSPEALLRDAQDGRELGHVIMRNFMGICLG